VRACVSANQSRTRAQSMTTMMLTSFKKTYVVSAHITLRQSEEFVAVGTCLHDFFEGEVHVCVALHQVAVEGFAVLELDEHGVALGGCEEAEGELLFPLGICRCCDEEG
jgi:hypothetical protein